jgi:hypothetical protein
MSALTYEADVLALDSEAFAALQRFDEDARTLCTASSQQGGGSARALHARATAAYRDALATGAGLPADRSWQIFIRSVAALVATPNVGQLHSSAAAAVARLRRIVEENADLLLPEAPSG